MFDLKKFRSDNKLSQVDVAFLFDCGQPNIAAIERDGRDLTPSQIDVLKSKFGDVSKYQFVGITQNDNNNLQAESNTRIDNINEIKRWETLVNRYEEYVTKLLNILESEKQEKAKLIDSINTLSALLVEKKAV